MSGRPRAKRGRQGESSGARAPGAIPLIPEHPLVRFRDLAHRETFVKMMGKRCNPTRFIDHGFMASLGLDAMLNDAFVGMGMPAFYGMRELTYESLTLEFLSTYDFDARRGVLQFRLMNAEVEISVAQLAEYFEFIREGDEPRTLSAPYNTIAFWTCMSDVPPNEVNVERLTTNAIQHPGLRMIFKTLGTSFTPRPDASKVNQVDVMLVATFLNPFRQPPCLLDLGYLLARYFKKAASGTMRSYECGGLITRLAKKRFQLDDIIGYAPMTEAVPLINDTWLTTYHHWVRRLPGQRWQWLVGGDRWMILPNEALAPLLSLPPSSPGYGMPSYLIPRELTTGGDPPTPRAPIPQVPPTQNPPSNFGDVPNMPYMRHPTSSYPIPQYDPNSFENRRHCQEAVMQGMANYRLFEHMEQLGIHQPTDIAPPYYAGIGNYPGSLFEDYGVSRDAWGSSYGQSYGGMGGQFLPGGSQYGDGSIYAQAGYDPNVYSSGYYGGGVPSSQGVGFDSNVAGPSGGHDDNDDDGNDDDE